MTTFSEIIEETEPLTGTVPVYGPPLLLVGAPWLLFGLMLAGPFALLVTIVVALAVASILLGAILIAPYVLARRLLRAWRAVPARRHVTAHAVVAR
jgi:hypothetical protein